MVDRPMRSRSVTNPKGDTKECEPKKGSAGGGVVQRLAGARAIYAVESVDPSQRKEIDEFFAEIGTVAQITKLSTGRLVAYAVQVGADFAELLDETAEALKSAYEHVIYMHPADELALDIISDLCRAARSRVLPVPCCGICGKRVLFPPTTVVVNRSGSRPTIKHYCPSCTADKCRQKTTDFVRALLEAERRNPKGSLKARLLRRKSRRDAGFTIACTTDGLAG